MPSAVEVLTTGTYARLPSFIKVHFYRACQIFAHQADFLMSRKAPMKKSSFRKNCVSRKSLPRTSWIASRSPSTSAFCRSRFPNNTRRSTSVIPPEVLLQTYSHQVLLLCRKRPLTADSARRVHSVANAERLCCLKGAVDRPENHHSRPAQR